jgi:predicted CopG family antitoxin
MPDTTTIEITDDQRDELEALKAHPNEPVRDVVERLLTEVDPQTTVEIPQEVYDRLERIEAAAKEATQTVQETHTQIEELQ